MPFSQLADCSLKSLSFPFSAPVFLKGHLKYLRLGLSGSCSQPERFSCRTQNLVSAHCLSLACYKAFTTRVAFQI